MTINLRNPYGESLNVLRDNLSRNNPIIEGIFMNYIIPRMVLDFSTRGR